MVSSPRKTRHLVLRPFTPEDITSLMALAGDKSIADTTISVPHPFTSQAAREWLEQGQRALAEGRTIRFAVERGELIGSAELRAIDREHNQAELSFWIGRPYWGNGYATEAAQAMLEIAFRELKLNRVHAHHMVRNPSSGRVLEKLGLVQEGLLRQCVCKWGQYEDVVLRAILRTDYLGSEDSGNSDSMS